jgi:hypothetical protein
MIGNLTAVAFQSSLPGGATVSRTSELGVQPSPVVAGRQCPLEQAAVRRGQQPALPGRPHAAVKLTHVGEKSMPPRQLPFPSSAIGAAIT